MALRYLKYLTNYGNTIVAESATPFTLGPNEAQIFTAYEIPVIQPLYLYAVNAGNVVVNTDPYVNAYLGSINSLPFDIKFTGYTATTQSRLVGIENNISYVSGQTNLRLRTSNFNVYSAATLTNINSRLLAVNFNEYSATTKSTIDGKLNTTDFNTYSANTISLIQSAQAGLDPKASVFVATIAPLVGVTYGGTAGTGQFTSAPTTLNGATLSNGKRILVKNQADPRQNGIYVVISTGVWNRSTDMDGNIVGEVGAGNHTFVETGSTLAGSGWVVVGNGSLTLNTDPIIWTQFNASTAYVAGTGILITGMTVSLNGSGIAGNALTWNGTQLNVNPTGGTLGSKFNTKLDQTTFNTYTGITAPATFLSISNFNAYSATTASGLNSKLGIAAFNVYSATTLTNINSRLLSSSFNVYSATTLLNINTRVLKTVFNTYTGTTVPTTYLGISAFNAYSATTLTNINSRLLKTTFNAYTASTVNVTSANNGLTKSGNNVRLGGGLTGATTIDATTFLLNLSGTTGQINIERTTGSVNLKSRNNISLIARSAANIDRVTLKLSSTGSTFTDARTGTTAVGLQYGGNYGANFTPRSFIDKGHFTGNTLHTSKQFLVYYSGTTNISVTTPINLTLNRLIRNDSLFYTYTGGTKVKILQAGIYDVSYQVNASNSNSVLKSVGANLLKNGTTLPETTTSGTIGAQAGAACNLSLPPTEIIFAANDVVSLSAFRLIVPTLGGTADTTPNAVFLSIVKKY